MRGIDPILGPDFAHRVIERVRKVRRRRQLRRWALTSTAAAAVVTVAIFFLPGHQFAPQPIPRAPRSGPNSEQISISELDASLNDSPSLGQPLAFFFPGAPAVADFESMETKYWHSYDSWWSQTSL